MKTNDPEGLVSLAKLEKVGAELYQCDFNSEENVRKFSDTVITKHSKLRGIIHNASDWLPDNHDRRPAV